MSTVTRILPIDANQPGSYEFAFSRELGRRIVALRLERGLTQRQLALLSGVSQPTVGRWEGGWPIELWQFLRLCDALRAAPLSVLPAHAAYLGTLAREAELERDPGLRKEEVQRERDSTLSYAEEMRLSARCERRAGVRA